MVGAFLIKDENKKMKLILALLFASGFAFASNLSPSINITAPLNGSSIITGDIVSITANAFDTDGTIVSVEFFIDGVSINVDSTAPFSSSYTGVFGIHTLTAKATDDLGAITISSVIHFNVKNADPPSVTINVPDKALVGDVVSILANASDQTHKIISVEFFIDEISIGTDFSAPFSTNWIAIFGAHKIKVKAINDINLSASDSSTILVSVNSPPAISITSPTKNSVFAAPELITIAAIATDMDGSITMVQFYVNNILINTDNSSPFSTTWTSIAGAASFIAKATDNKGAVTISDSIALNIAEPKTYNYQLTTMSTPFFSTQFCLPLKATDTVKHVIGYDMTIHYEKNKITPKGVTMSNELITPSYVSVISQIDTAAALITVSVFLNASAPANSSFNGVGELFCLGFIKKAAFKSIDTTVVSVSSFQESYITGVTTKLVKTGKYISYNDTTLQIELTENPNTPIINIYPNPVNSGLLNVLVSEKANVQLFDASGRWILSASVNANEKQTINVDDLTNGIYSLRIQNDEFVSVKRLVINK
jgi:hypothetical protein